MSELNWDYANAWEKLANGEKEDWEQPVWKWDCNFKLDFDGSLLRVTSRFYPPTSYYGMTWDGTVTVCLYDKELFEKKFDCPTLDELKIEVEKYVESLRAKVEILMKGLEDE